MKPYSVNRQSVKVLAKKTLLLGNCTQGCIVYRHAWETTARPCSSSLCGHAALNTRLTIGARNYRYMAWVVKHS